jgi:hypothetical protein
MDIHNLNNLTIREATVSEDALIAQHYSLKCTHAILHASPYGKPLYESLGFVPKNEMILELNL